MGSNEHLLLKVLTFILLQGTPPAFGTPPKQQIATPTIEAKNDQNKDDQYYKVGDQVTFTCTPPANAPSSTKKIIWAFNMEDIEGQNGETWTKSAIEEDDFGYYTCRIEDTADDGMEESDRVEVVLSEDDGTFVCTDADRRANSTQIMWGMGYEKHCQTYFVEDCGCLVGDMVTGLEDCFFKGMFDEFMGFQKEKEKTIKDADFYRKRGGKEELKSKAAECEAKAKPLKEGDKTKGCKEALKCKDEWIKIRWNESGYKVDEEALNLEIPKVVKCFEQYVPATCTGDNTRTVQYTYEHFKDMLAFSKGEFECINSTYSGDLNTDKSFKFYCKNVITKDCGCSMPGGKVLPMKECVDKSEFYGRLQLQYSIEQERAEVMKKRDRDFQYIEVNSKTNQCEIDARSYQAEKGNRVPEWIPPKEASSGFSVRVQSPMLRAALLIPGVFAAFLF